MRNQIFDLESGKYVHWREAKDGDYSPYIQLKARKLEKIDFEARIEMEEIERVEWDEIHGK